METAQWLEPSPCFHLVRLSRTEAWLVYLIFVEGHSLSAKGQIRKGSYLRTWEDLKGGFSTEVTRLNHCAPLRRGNRFLAARLQSALYSGLRWSPGPSAPFREPWWLSSGCWKWRWTLAWGDNDTPVASQRLWMDFSPWQIHGYEQRKPDASWMFNSPNSPGLEAPKIIN